MNQPGAMRDGIFGAFGAYVQPEQVGNGVFGATEIGPVTVNGGLVTLTDVGEQLFRAVQPTSCVQQIPAPSTDLVYQLTATPQEQCGQNGTSLLQELVMNLGQQGYVPLVETTFFLTGAYFSKVIFTRSSATILALTGGLNALAPAPSIGRFAVAQTDTDTIGLALISEARGAVNTLTPGAVGPAPAAKASFLSTGTGTLVMVGGAALLLWALSAGKKRS